MPTHRRRIGSATVFASLLIIRDTFAFSVRPCACRPCFGKGRLASTSMRSSVSLLELAARKRRRGRTGTPGTTENSNDQISEGKSYEEGADLDCPSSLSSSSKYYQPNRRERMELILERDGYNCVWCRVPLNIDTATTDHLLPRIKGGPSWIENELASCGKCNKMRGHAMPLDWLDECRQQRGWDSNDEAIGRGLHALDGAIMRKGGQRRVRPYLARQLKVLKKHDA